MPAISGTHAALHRRVERGVLAAGAGAALIGLVVLAGWALGMPALQTLGVSRSAMSPLTALGLVALGAALPGALAPRRSWWLRASNLLAGSVVAVGTLKILTGLTQLAVIVDAVIFGSAVWHTANRVGPRVAPAAAVLFVTTGMAVILTGRRSRMGDVVAQTLAIATLLLSQATLVGHAFDGYALENVAAFSRMASHTAIAFSLLAAGVLGARPRSGVAAVLGSDGPGGRMARHMLPAALLLPAALAWLVLFGKREGMFVPQLSELLFVLGVTLAFSVLVAWNAVQLHQKHVQHERAIAALRDSEARFRLLTEHGRDMVYIIDLDGKLLYASPSSERVLGFRPNELTGSEPYDMIHPDDRPRILANHEALLRGEPTSAVSYRRLHRDGHYVWLESLGRAVLDDDGHVLRLHIAARDITERKMYEARLDAARLELEEQHAQLLDANAKLEALATLDGLTNLKNRRAFAERLGQEVSRSRRAGTPVSLLLLDIDHFKQFNDAFGHPRGDEVLRFVARIIQRGVRDTDFAARYGGEEFAVILPDTSREEARLLAERLRHAVESVEWPDRAVTVSVGTATLGPAQITGDALLEQADQALYRSKDAGRNVVTVSGQS